ncbi:MAG TPA: hypothetical protein PKE41_05875 [Candidatus Macondimonas sp.]|nr:hypothetical protein [Candidatus Macondimonas sp.]
MISPFAAHRVPSQPPRRVVRGAWLGLVLALGLLLPVAQHGALRHALEHVSSHGHHEPSDLPDPGTCKACTAFGVLGGMLPAVALVILARGGNPRLPARNPPAEIPTTVVTTRARAPPPHANA